MVLDNVKRIFRGGTTRETCRPHPSNPNIKICKREQVLPDNTTVKEGEVHFQKDAQCNVIIAFTDEVKPGTVDDLINKYGPKMKANCERGQNPPDY